MPIQPAQVFSEPLDVERELATLGLTVDFVKKVASQSRSAKMETLPIDPCNSPGTQAYMYGVRAIRRALLRKKGWRISRMGNVEATVNDKLGIQILFQNVDLACSLTHEPESVSGKGGGARQMIRSGNQGELFSNNQPKHLGKIGCIPKVWLVCVSSNENTLKAEVSAPKDFEGEQFDGFSRRIFVIDESFEPKIHSTGENSPTGDSDIEVLVRKKS